MSFLRIGHRGLAAYAPENTLAGIRCARAFGLEWAEVDVRLSADNVAVLSHDSSLLRRGGVRARVCDKTAAQLAAIPVGRGFGAEFAREGAPSLADALALLRELKMGAIIEIKPHKNREAAAVRAVADAIHLAPSRVVVSSFSAPILEAAREIMPAVSRAFVCERADDSVFALLHKTAAAELHCGAQTPARALQKFAAAGFRARCFTVNDAAIANKLREAGAGGVFTDTGLPELFAAPENADGESSDSIFASEKCRKRK